MTNDTRSPNQRYCDILNALKQANLSGGNAAVKCMLSSPNAATFGKDAVAVLGEGGAHNELFFSLDNRVFGNWVIGASAMLAVCVPAYPGNHFTNSMTPKDKNPLMPTQPEAQDLMKAACPPP